MQRFTSGQETFEQVVDRLLASPQYGERWGRHWLDVARYADSTGNDNRRGQLARYIYAHTYRDWVIESMNEDKPYNQFLIEQFAADRQKGDHGDLAALGFLTLGPRIAGGDEIIDDRIDVTTRGGFLKTGGMINKVGYFSCRFGEPLFYIIQILLGLHIQ